MDKLKLQGKLLNKLKLQGKCSDKLKLQGKINLLKKQDEQWFQKRENEKNSYLVDKNKYFFFYKKYTNQKIE